ncbi:MAG: SGNH/GDSL hydrolase family protein [Bacteroidetes bacterium]|nr:SGNH/GDSL hydrolase family protein [Bacteroidota bacterium]
MIKRKDFAGMILLLLAIAVGYATYLYSGNILYNYPDWISTKTILHKHAMGAQAFRMTKVALKNDRLNLSAWHGFQELLYKDGGTLENASFYLHLKRSCAYFIFGKTEESMMALRLSNSWELESALLHLDSDGRIVQETAIDRGFSRKRRQYKIRLEFEPSVLKLMVNGETIQLEGDFDNLNGLTGFRGEWRNIGIDDIKLNFKDGRVVEEDFDTVFSWNARIFFYLLAGAILLALVFVWAFRRNGILYAGIFTFSLAVILSLSYYYKLSGLYPTNYKRIDWNDVESKIELPEHVVDRLLEEYSGEKAADERRILFIGSSQTWGAGASAEDKLLTNLIVRNLQKMEGSAQLKAVNAGISATYSRFLYETWMPHYDVLQPDIVIMNFGINDFDLEVFRDYMIRFIKLHRSYGIPTVFVQEPTKFGYPFIDEKHKVLADVGREFDIPVIPMHSYIQEEIENGWLWWDPSHLSDFGQLLFAEYFVQALHEEPELLDLLKMEDE